VPPDSLIVGHHPNFRPPQNRRNPTSAAPSVGTPATPDCPARAISDAKRKEIAGLGGGLFNIFGNISSITTPIVIGYILHATGSFNGTLVFIGANPAIAILSRVVVFGEIKHLRRLPLSELPGHR
jgi:hypothetical protein